MALAWVLRNPVVTTALIGVSKVSQIEDNLAALKNPNFTPKNSPPSIRFWRAEPRPTPAIHPSNRESTRIDANVEGFASIRVHSR